MKIYKFKTCITTWTMVLLCSCAEYDATESHDADLEDASHDQTMPRDDLDLGNNSMSPQNMDQSGYYLDGTFEVDLGPQCECDVGDLSPGCVVQECGTDGSCTLAVEPKNGQVCYNTAPGTYDGLCEEGICVGQKSCECSDSGPCCDGCHIREAGFICGRGNSTFHCEGTCGGINVNMQELYLCDGETTVCSTTPEVQEVGRRTCPENFLCTGDLDEGLCISSDMCDQ